MSKRKNIQNLQARISLSIIFFLLPVFTAAQEIAGHVCTSGKTNCFFAENTPPSAAKDADGYAPLSPTSIVTMYVRTLHGGPLAHHWIELESSRGPVTIGYGPATIPFIDAGQISIWYADGEVEKRGRLPLLSTHFNYAKPPGSGHVIGEPIHLTLAQSDTLIEKQRRRRFVFPYIPIFHDCRTFVCAMQSSVNGKSALPCYLLFKGYW